MGDLVGGILGGVGSIVGAGIQANAQQQAAAQALTGYNYITTGAGSQPANNIIAAGQEGTAGSLTAEDAQSQLLGLKPASAGTSNAFNNYLGSTGYNFQLQQGAAAINANAASKGLLNSGGTAKALTAYGQNLGSSYFNNYLNQVGGLNTQLQNTATAGQNQLGAIANAGTGAGSNAAGYIAGTGNALSNGVNGALGSFGNVLTNAFAGGGVSGGSGGGSNAGSVY